MGAASSVSTGAGIELLATIATFAVLGGLKTVMGARKNNEKWKWAKGRYETVIVAIVGAIAGVFTLYVGADLSAVVFGAAVMTVGVLVREAMKIGETSYEHFQDLLDQGVPREEAALRGLKHGWEKGDVEEVRESIATLLETAGYLPSDEQARRRTEETREAYDEEGPRGAVENVMGEDGLDEGLEDDDEGDDDEVLIESADEIETSEITADDESDDAGVDDDVDESADEDDGDDDGECPDDGPIVIDHGP